MTQSNPPLPQSQLEPADITFDQYAEYTPEKLERLTAKLEEQFTTSVKLEAEIRDNLKGLGYG